ncbi:MAG: PcfJ domain-containing protein [Bacteroidota bacterium]
MFAKYPVPRFMNQAFTKGNEMHIDWFIRLGRGENLRKVPHLPFAISKKMAHYFVEEQGRRQIEDAFIYGIIRGMGGSRELTRQILANTQYDFYQHPQFWATVFRFLVDHPKLSFDQISPLMDYIHFQKFEPQMRVIRRTQLVSNGPPQPNFEMKGRTVTSLIRAMEKWHEEYRMNTLNRGKEREKLIRWAPVKVRDFKCLVDEGPQSGEYRIVQLLNNWELMDEGKTLGHCVASYVYACTQKRASIWSFFRDEGKKRMTKLLTIEMNNHNRNLVQIRGAHNSRALDWQMEIIHQWVKQEKLKISEWV